MISINFEHLFYKVKESPPGLEENKTLKTVKIIEFNT